MFPFVSWLSGHSVASFFCSCSSPLVVSFTNLQTSFVCSTRAVAYVLSISSSMPRRVKSVHGNVEGSRRQRRSARKVARRSRSAIASSERDTQQACSSSGENPSVSSVGTTTDTSSAAKRTLDLVFIVNADDGICGTAEKYFRCVPTKKSTLCDTDPPSQSTLCCVRVRDHSPSRSQSQQAVLLTFLYWK